MGWLSSLHHLEQFVGAGGYAAGQDRVLISNRSPELSRREAGAGAEVNAAQVGTEHVCAGEVCARHIRAAQVGFAQAGVRQVGVPERRALQVSSVERCIDEDRLGEVAFGGL